jgi:hypothetical protein
MKHLLCTALFCAQLCASAWGQANPNNPSLANGASVSDEIINLSSGGYYSTALQFDNRYKGIKGSPFVQEEWSEGTLYLTDSTIVGTPLKYKFDAYSNEIWTKDAAGQEIVLYSHQFWGLDLKKPDGSRWTFRKMAVPGESDPHRFYRVLYAGSKYTLFDNLRKTIKRADYQDRGLYTSGSTDDAFEEKNTYWLRVADQSVKEAGLKKNALLRALPSGVSSRAESYCKKQGLKGKLSENEALGVLQFLEKL